MHVGCLEAQTHRAHGRVVRNSDVAAIEQTIPTTHHVYQFIFRLADAPAQAQIQILEEHDLCGKTHIDEFVTARLPQLHARQNRMIPAGNIGAAALEELLLNGNVLSVVEENGPEREAGIERKMLADADSEIGCPISAQEQRRGILPVAVPPHLHGQVHLQIHLRTLGRIEFWRCNCCA